jgi:hypothetical protein
MHQGGDPALVLRRGGFPRVMEARLECLDGLLEGAPGRDRGRHGAERTFGCLAGEPIERVAERHLDALSIPSQGHRLVPLTPVGLDQPQQLPVELGKGRLHARESELIGQHLDELPLVDEVLFHQDLAEALSGKRRVLLGLERRPQLRRPQVPELHQEAAQRHYVALGTQGIPQLLVCEATELLEDLYQ